MGMAFPHPFVLRNYISTALGQWAVEILFLHTKGCGNAPFTFKRVILFLKGKV